MLEIALDQLAPSQLLRTGDSKQFYTPYLYYRITVSIACCCNAHNIHLCQNYLKCNAYKLCIVMLTRYIKQLTCWVSPPGSIKRLSVNPCFEYTFYINLLALPNLNHPMQYTKT